jgi:ABC-type sugar transport system substrate-binding protein
VFTCRAAETGVVQGDVLLKMADYSKKVGNVTEIECEDETPATGLTKMENLYTTNPEIKLFLSAHNGLAQGISNFFTGINSPVTDYSDMGIFCINGDTAVYDMIKASVEGKNPLRGTVMTGSVQDTANELRDMIVGIVDGTVKPGHVQKAGTLFVYADTIEEFLSTGTITSVTNADFDK